MALQTKLRALFVVNSLTGGGAERVFATLVRELVHAQDMEISVAILDEGLVEAYNLPPGIPIERLDVKGAMLRSIIQLYRLVRRSRPDVALAFLSRANVAAVVAMGLAGKPAVISERVNTKAHLGSGLASLPGRILIRLCYPRAQSIVAASQGVADTLVQDFHVNRSRVRVIHNPVDVDAIRALAQEDARLDVSVVDFVTMGRLVPNKNTAMAIQALAASHSVGRLIVLGEGPLKRELIALAASLGLADRVVFAGFLPNPYAVLARAGCYLLTSNAEGFPNALVEAMALGLPAIATDCPSGPAEILATNIDQGASAVGVGGALVAMNDHVAMAKCMDQLAVPEFRLRMARDAATRVAAFSVERAVKSFEETIRQAAAGNRRPIAETAGRQVSSEQGSRLK